MPQRLAPAGKQTGPHPQEGARHDLARSDVEDVDPGKPGVCSSILGADEAGQRISTCGAARSASGGTSIPTSLSAGRGGCASGSDVIGAGLGTRPEPHRSKFILPASDEVRLIPCETRPKISADGPRLRRPSGSVTFLQHCLSLQALVHLRACTLLSSSVAYDYVRCARPVRHPSDECVGVLASRSRFPSAAYKNHAAAVGRSDYRLLPDEAPMLRSNPALLRAGLPVLVLLASGTAAHSHGWYPWECCSDNDCAPISLNETPKERDGGFYLIDGRHISYREVKPSPDGQWHLCEQKWPAKVSDRKILCVYAPFGGS
jgi:hypothetical protein